MPRRRDALRGWRRYRHGDRRMRLGVGDPEYEPKRKRRKMKKSHLSIQRDYERRWTRNVAIMQDYNSGLAIDTIASQYEMSVGGIARIARQMGCKKRRPGNSPDVRKAVELEYRCGTKIKDICATYGIDRKTLWAICKQAGVPLRQRRS